jgi:UDP-N-acetylglucosamine--N-acetylmuramyl-(pentapeptide) pyrophosphoryl-undecaprenol N-acetylglucosamine transferase
MSGKGAILVCAGGTGGHLFPAEALSHVLTARGHAVHLATDERATRYAASFPAAGVHVVPSATPSGSNPIKLAGAALTLMRGYRQSRHLIAQIGARAAIGFGGYPTVPPMLAATRMGLATAIHESNAVLGRANRLLESRVDRVAMGFAGVRTGDRTIVSGNPVRPAVIEASALPYPMREAGDPFRLLIFGGSQGAQFFSQALPAAIALLDPAQRQRLRIVQQARTEDEAALRTAYAGLGLEAEIAPFFADMASRIASAHYVISRAGASTVSELSVIGRPALLVPYPHALDHDQAQNAAAIAASGGAEIVLQADLVPQRLAEKLDEAMRSPQRLAGMAASARSSGRPDAAERLADLIEALIAERAAQAR